MNEAKREGYLSQFSKRRIYRMVMIGMTHSTRLISSRVAYQTSTM